MADIKEQGTVEQANPIRQEQSKGHDVSQVERVVSASEFDEKDHIDYGRIDQEISPEENKRLKRMIDRRVLPIMIFTYFLQALDKGTLSFCIDHELSRGFRTSPRPYSWLTTCIYIAVLVVEYPTNWIIQHVPLGKYLGANIVLRGSVLACHAAAVNFPSILALRTLLGIFEAVCQPAFLVMSSMWYKREEQAEIVTYWYMMNGGQQIVGGILSYCFTLLKTGPITSWQALFITYGTFSVLWGLFVLWWLPDSPMRAQCFSEEDKRLMIERVRGNQTGMQNRKFRPEQVKEALSDLQTCCYCLIAICTTLPTSGRGAFANIIITGFKFTVLQSQLLAMVLGAVIIIILLTSTWLVKKTGQNLIVVGFYVIPSFVGTIVLMTVENKNKASQAAFSSTLAMSMISRNVAGQTKKTVVISANFVSWCTGNAIGPQVFLSWNAPHYFIAFATHIGCYVLLVIVIVFLRFYLKTQNDAKDQLAAEGDVGARDGTLIHSFED
ncbi:MFS transporter [Eremomyces bilateralis CBS 781.70]|uniref:MFS transporter n=1 Tax=Eremomyces bilateralis CBS 781.70 TaxID=1392243 RepID=A0A6G1G7Q3_9PEZI|nr:MFS transporter [Eremomyces bilateralis CBS 781.70]KAF1813879.1 MFS transporter [Eremomyces bilateralis CBS 781.70]